MDRIECIELDRRPDGSACGRIVTRKALSLAEEYLADHFPAFPVLPGVLMLEALVQSAAWLVRVEQDFAKSIIVLKSARNVRYLSFVQPGKALRCEVEAIQIGKDQARFKGAGFVDETQAVSARLELSCFNLAERQSYLAEADKAIIAQLRHRFKLIGGPGALAECGKAQ
ncbi:MAG: 3-hydroxyacyl-ACP dehydratase FabZ family protein [Planctomycetota bacterium]